MVEECAVAVEELLDEMKPRKEEWPSGPVKECYIGALAALEAMGIDWVQLESGQHVILRRQ